MCNDQYPFKYRQWSAVAWWCHQVGTFSVLLGLCEGKSPLTMASDAELWCVLWSALEQTVELITETPVVWDAHYDVTVMFLSVFRHDIFCVDDLAQDCSISRALAMKLLQSCISPGCKMCSYVNCITYIMYTAVRVFIDCCVLCSRYYHLLCFVSG